MCISKTEVKLLLPTPAPLAGNSYVVPTTTMKRSANKTTMHLFPNLETEKMRPIILEVKL